MKNPNVVFVFGDQWRAQAVGYAGDPNVKTPNLDRLAAASVNFSTAVANCPVCSPYRASLLTGRYPHTHGIVLNDAHLGHEAVSLADAFKTSGYDTAYIGKWHLDGRGRTQFIPPDSRQGFEFWRVMECTHDYNRSGYYAEENEKLLWPGYDAEAQTAEAEKYIRNRSGDRPFLLVLSWGPPHNPYETAPQKFKDLYNPERIVLRPNVPVAAEENARRDLAGYYAHCSALDACVGRLLKTLDDRGLADETVFVFTSDHGDMLHSHGEERKQRPWDEAVRVPFLLRAPGLLGKAPREIRTPLNSPDLMPTLLGLCGLPVPETVEGRDFSGLITERGGECEEDGGGGEGGRRKPSPKAAALIACYHPFGEWQRDQGGREYRGVRTARFTYVRDLQGPWLLYDNEKDPYQLENLCGREESAELQARLETLLERELRRLGDEFPPSEVYLKKWGYADKVDESGTLPTLP